MSNEEKYIAELNDRIKNASSEQSRNAYEMALMKFKRIYKL